MSQTFTILNYDKNESFDPEAVGDTPNSGCVRAGSPSVDWARNRIPHWKGDLIVASGSDGDIFLISGDEKRLDALRKDWKTRDWGGWTKLIPAELQPGIDEFPSDERPRYEGREPSEALDSLLALSAWRSRRHGENPNAIRDLLHRSAAFRDAPTKEREEIIAALEAKAGRDVSVDLSDALTICHKNHWRFERNPPRLLHGGNSYDFSHVDLDDVKLREWEQLLAPSECGGWIEGSINRREDGRWEISMNDHYVGFKWKSEGDHLKPLWAEAREAADKALATHAIATGKDFIDPTATAWIDDGGRMADFVRKLGCEAVPFAPPGPNADVAEARLLLAFQKHTREIFVPSAGGRGEPGAVRVSQLVDAGGRTRFFGKTGEALRKTIETGRMRAMEKNADKSKGDAAR